MSIISICYTDIWSLWFRSKCFYNSIIYKIDYRYYINRKSCLVLWELMENMTLVFGKIIHNSTCASYWCYYELFRQTRVRFFINSPQTYLNYAISYTNFYISDIIILTMVVTTLVYCFFMQYITIFTTCQSWLHKNVLCCTVMSLHIWYLLYNCSQFGAVTYDDHSFASNQCW